ncbi:GRAM domain family protein [Pelomyxa schiedti]|nr:GRAM domain family protein [Pelomyxa schiedti]
MASRGGIALTTTTTTTTTTIMTDTGSTKGSTKQPAVSVTNTNSAAAKASPCCSSQVTSTVVSKSAAPATPPLKCDTELPVLPLNPTPTVTEVNFPFATVASNGNGTKPHALTSSGPCCAGTPPGTPPRTPPLSASSCLEESKKLDRANNEPFPSKFNLSPQETLLYETFCGLYKVIPIHGRMYLSQQHICFYCKLFGTETKEEINFRDVISLTKKIKPVFLPGIEIVTQNNVYFFCSFVSRDKAFQKITELWEATSAAITATEYAAGLAHPPVEPETTTVTQVSSPTDSEKPSPQPVVETSASPLQMESTPARKEDTSPPRTEEPATSSQLCETLPIDTELDEDSSHRAEAFLACQLTELLRCDFPIPVKTFFEYFYSSSTSFTSLFHSDHGDKDLVVTDWAVHPTYGIVREKRYQVPVVAPIGPNTSRVVETQSYYNKNSSKQLVVQTISVMLDIPYGDYFRIEAKWEVTPRDTGCTLVVSSGVNFSKRTLMKGTILSSAMKQTRESYNRWVILAKEFLEHQNARASPPVPVLQPQPQHPQLNQEAQLQQPQPQITAAAPPQPEPQLQQLQPQVQPIEQAERQPQYTSTTTSSSHETTNAESQQLHKPHQEATTLLTSPSKSPIVILILIAIIIYLILKLRNVESRIDALENLFLDKF